MGGKVGKPSMVGHAVAVGKITVAVCVAVGDGVSGVAVEASA